MISYDKISQQIVGSPTSVSQLQCIREVQLLSTCSLPKVFFSVGISYLLPSPSRFRHFTFFLICFLLA
jgi:hypothetical protein